MQPLTFARLTSEIILQEREKRQDFVLYFQSVIKEKISMYLDKSLHKKDIEPREIK